MVRKYPALPLLVAVVSGIIVGDRTGWPSWAFLTLGLGAILIALLCLARSRTNAAVLFAIISVGALAGFHFVIRHVERGPHHAATVLDSRNVVRLFGEISDWPDLRSDHTDFVVELDSVDASGVRHVDGRILLRVTDTTTALQRGDRIECYGRVYLVDPRSADHVPSIRRLALREICGTVYLPTLLNVRVDRRPASGIWAVVDRIRGWILRVFDETLSPSSSALAGGFLLGETRHIPTDVYALFRDSGTLHVLAVSGSNVAMVLLFVLVIMRPLGVRHPWRGVILLVVVFLFALLSHSQPSVLRASTMAAFILLADILGREYDLNHIVSLTVLVILAVAPAQLYDVGFQLSAVTAWGLVLLVQPATRLFERWHNTLWYRWLVFPVIVSVVAQLCSAPLIAYYFGRVPLVSVPANLLVAPLASLVVVLLLGTLFAYLLLPIAGLLIGSLTTPILDFLVAVLHWFKTLEWTATDTGPLIHFPLAELWIALYYSFIATAIFGLIRRRFRKWAAGILIVAVNLFLAMELITAHGPSPGIHFSSLPGGIVSVVEQGDGKTADCIIASGRVRIESIDARLLQPLLDMHRVRKLRYLFVLSVTYDNIDDLLRIAVSNQCERMYVAAGNRPSFEDYLAYHPEHVPPPITYFGGTDTGMVSDGYRLSESVVALRSRGHSYLFAMAASGLEDIPTEPLGVDATMIVATRWTPTAGDWITLRDRGVDRIICSRIEQLRSGSDDSSPVDDADIVLPDFVVDLYRSGPYKLPL